MRIQGKKLGAPQELDADRHELEARFIQDLRDMLEAVMAEGGSLLEIPGAELKVLRGLSWA